MVSKAEGNLVLLVWSDDGEVTPIADDNGIIPVEEQSPLTTIQAQGYGYQDGAWRKLAMVWGYGNRVREDLGGTKSGDGTYHGLSTAVPDSRVYVVQGIYLVNTTAQRGVMRLSVWDTSLQCTLAWASTPLADEYLMWSGEIVLKEGDQVHAQQSGSISGDVYEGLFWGYEMVVGPD